MRKAVNDAEIMEEFTRIRQADDVLLVEVGQVRWHGPHTPEIEWGGTGVALPLDASPETIRGARLALLARRKFFRICVRCEERMPLGWMEDDGSICQSCAERFLGVVH